MRFFWFHTTTHGTAVAPSALVSVVAHAAFLGATMYGSGPQSSLWSALEQPHIYYLPPPDRTLGRRAVMEHVQYVEIGAGEPARGPESPNGQRAGSSEVKRTPKDGGVVGESAAQQAGSSPLDSPDSVYSVLSVEETALRVEGSAAPIYPAEMLAQGIEGVVRTRYVIDTTGHADSGSFIALGASNTSFERAVRAAVPGMRFTAALVQGHPVRQMVEQEFQFRITAVPALVPPGVPAEHTWTRVP